MIKDTKITETLKATLVLNFNLSRSVHIGERMLLIIRVQRALLFTEFVSLCVELLNVYILCCFTV